MLDCCRTMHGSPQVDVHFTFWFPIKSYWPL